MDTVLGVIRYSGEDEAGALDRYAAMLDAWLAENAATAREVHRVVDETVSGAVNLDQRKSLKDWLVEPKLSEWTTMLVPEQDRITRDDIHWWAFVGKILEWGKKLVVLDDPGLDLSTPNGRMIAGIKATQAANYRLDVKKKLLRAREDYRGQKRYVGGHWPYGHRVAPRADGPGWSYVVDETAATMVAEMIHRVNKGESLRKIAFDWNQRGILSARDHQSQTKMLKPGEIRKKPKGHKWEGSSLMRIMFSVSLLGYGEHKGEILRKDGIPIPWMPPIAYKDSPYFTVDELLAAQKVITERGRGMRGLRQKRSPLLGVVFCKCGAGLNSKVDTDKRYNKVYRYYQCAVGAQYREYKTCKYNVLWPLEFVKGFLEERFLFEVGDHEIRRKLFVPGENFDVEINQLKEAIDYLTGNLARLAPGSRAADSIIETLGRHESRLDDLEKRPATQATYYYESTGETFAQRWHSLVERDEKGDPVIDEDGNQVPDWDERGLWLLRSGIRAVFAGSPKAPEMELITPPDLIDRTERAAEGK